MEYNKIFSDLKVLQGGCTKVEWGKPTSPQKMFYEWLGEAISIGCIEPHAMTLSTANHNGDVSSRVLLVRHVDEHSNFYFSTSKVNPTGRQLTENPKASLNFYIKEMSRQIIVSGFVEACSIEDSRNDFSKRSLDSKSICLVGKQSTHLDDFDSMHLAAMTSKERLSEEPNLINENWTLYKLVPNKIEFFQGRKSRMHERLVYNKDENSNWVCSLIWA